MARLTDKQRLAVARRVLRFVDRYLARIPNQGTLVTDGRGVNTWAEIRQHVRLAARLGTRKEPKRTGPKVSK